MTNLLIAGHDNGSIKVATLNAMVSNTPAAKRMPNDAGNEVSHNICGQPMNEINGYDFEDLTAGMSATFAKTITEADILFFAGASGDNNAVHINEEFAKTTQFKGRIAHGMLTASIISSAIAGRLPGPGTVYLGQNLRFKAPVRPGDTVQAKVTVTELIIEKRRVVLSTVCTVGGKVVIDGDALVMPTSRVDRVLADPGLSALA